MFFWRASDGSVDLVITDRSAGRSTGSYAGLNLGGHVGDQPDAVESNRRDLAAELGLERERLLFMDQRHGADVALVDGPHQPDRVPAVDGLVSTTPGLGLGVLVADCTPVLLWDNRTGVVAAAHAGRPGLIAGIVPRVVEAMRDAGAGSIEAVVGPSVCGRCYEVPDAMREAAAVVAPSSRALSWAGTPAIDIATGVVEQLDAHDVRVRWVAGCTRERDDLYSYRRDGRTGRFAGVVVLRP